MFSTTPREITLQIMRLCKVLVSNPAPKHVVVVPESSAVLGECFDNVRRKVDVEGGTIQYGWQIWEWPNIYIEAEFHAVWLSPTNSLVDITPKDEPVDCILFLPDLVRTYEGKSIDNVRRALRKDKLIHDFLTVAAEINKLKINGQNPNNPNEFKAPVELFQKLTQRHLILQEMLNRGESENSMCFCGSAKKYKNCHAL
jgi:hypothetical protein